MNVIKNTPSAFLGAVLRLLLWILRWLRRLLLVALMVFLTTLTPIFASVVGGALFLIGELYGKDSTGSSPTAYVVVGGGLTRAKLGSDIVLNAYSLLRTEALWDSLQEHFLPVITSGVESPWMIENLSKLAAEEGKLPPMVAENASMNTCENVQFSVKLMHYEAQEGTLPTITHIYLVSDWYHMARLRRHFANLGIATTPIVATMPQPLAWTNPKSNINHSRRAFYESVALLRDIFSPQTGCRSADSISIETLKTPRKSVKTF